MNLACLKCGKFAAGCACHALWRGRMVCSSLERASALLVRHTDLCFAHANCDAAGEAALIEACAQEEPEPLALHRLQTAYGLFRTLYRKLAAVPTPTYDWKQHQAVDDRLGPWAQRSKRTVRGTGRRASAHACGWFAPAADCVFIAGHSYTAYTARAQHMHVTSMLPGPRRKWCPAHGPPSALPGRSRRRRRARLPRRSGAGRGRSATWWCRSMPKASWHRLRPAGSPKAAFSARARLRLPRAPASLANQPLGPRWHPSPIGLACRHTGGAVHGARARTATAAAGAAPRLRGHGVRARGVPCAAAAAVVRIYIYMCTHI